jgi:hypothetical protein
MEVVSFVSGVYADIVPEALDVDDVMLGQTERPDKRNEGLLYLSFTSKGELIMEVAPKAVKIFFVPDTGMKGA